MTAPTPMFSELYVFGDSLSDPGNFVDLTGTLLDVALPADALGFNQTFTNAELVGDGNIWTTEIVSLLSLDPDSVEYLAFGGARAMGTRTLEEVLLVSDRELLLRDGVNTADYGTSVLSPGVLATLPTELRDNVAATNDVFLSGQVQNALAIIAAKGGPAENSAATFLIGGNDYASFDPIQTTPEAFLTELVTNIVGGAQALAAAGVDTLIYATQPALSFAPVSEQLVQQLAQTLIDAGLDPAAAQAQAQQSLQGLDLLVDQQNALVVQGFDAIGAAFGTEIRVVDFARLAQAISDDASGFGFKFVDYGRIFAAGTDPLPFQDANGNGIPDVGFDPTTNTIIDLPEPFLPVDTDGDGTPEAFAIVDARTEGVENDELAFIDGYHPSAAAQDILAQFYVATLEDRVTFLGDDADTFRGDASKEVVFGEGGDDTIFLRGGDDVAFGGLGDDAVFGNAGADLMSGGGGGDFLAGGGGGDVIGGGDGDDVLLGQRGDDVLWSGFGNDFMSGGGGNDVLIVKAEAEDGGNKVVLGGRGYDVAFIEVASADLQAASDALAGFSGGPLTLEIAGNTIALFGVEEVVLGDTGDVGGFDLVDFQEPAALQQSYQAAFANVDPETIDAVNAAAQWNLVDPLFIDII